MCIMISGILITAKCHMHVSQSWDLYTGLKTNMLTFVRVLKKMEKKKCRQEWRLMYYCWANSYESLLFVF